MKFAIPEISWHNRDPVLSVDFQPKNEPNDPLRLATGGTDTHVVIWYISISDTGSVNLEVAADLTRHQKAVNVVRWSPSGKLLASGDDESIIFVWKQKTEDLAPPLEGEEQYKETWVIHKTLRGHMEDVLDLSWSSDSLFIASGSIDNKLIVWDVSRGRYTHIVSDHKGFVQGVAWDPLGQLIGTACSDREFRTIDISTKKVHSRSSKAVLPFPKEHTLYDTRVRLYHDDTLQTYYRRLHFSPDGLFIAVPGGRIEAEQGKVDVKPMNAVYIYTRYSLKVPACILPCADPALAVRWSSRRYALRSSGPTPAFPTPYRLVLAVATKRSILIYDTQQKSPIALISNIHYTRLTDLSWSNEGQALVASSTDGFCSVVTFSKGELGELVPNDPPIVAMEIDEPEIMPEQRPEEKPVKNKNDLPKIDSFIKFKTPVEKSPKKQKVETIKQKTPVKVDLLVETAMSSWSDNSNSEVIKPDSKSVPEIIVLEDSSDVKLYYEESESSVTESNQISPKNKEMENKMSDILNVTEKLDDSENNYNNKQPKAEKDKISPKNKTQGSRQRSLNVDFLKQAKVTDIKEAVAVKSAPSPKAPRRVSFVTLSSPKNKKSC
ncbi:chromatin assembly factor 1 subunit B isoform X1 [Pieris brassicae]|uniref:chromatin assembly factor 1 subunit B isoform X1 n=1 Tax=Pieris brassicae TaxID=7116 RepID=UPI001E65E900|nr:chromatin assembly factor 1 subunit B isoform X1 [Pieris brassicae]